ncbi:hypothetical protein FA13DRAFT_1346044 [Coprinellus micaceus]|uniref:Uncharacterized protein n=1 Tax=Coprinellus micaceus TaxID=71717 RepID=A0A4Y7TPI3_COPMI|nr:hypothetical protein FA13DRAFT_1346044 [Coprinellus micaceus]
MAGKWGSGRGVVMGWWRGGGYNAPSVLLPWAFLTPIFQPGEWNGSSGTQGKVFCCRIQPLTFGFLLQELGLSHCSFSEVILWSLPKMLELGLGTIASTVQSWINLATGESVLGSKASILLALAILAASCFVYYHHRCSTFQLHTRRAPRKSVVGLGTGFESER